MLEMTNLFVHGHNVRIGFDFLGVRLFQDFQVHMTVVVIRVGLSQYLLHSRTVMMKVVRVAVVQRGRHHHEIKGTAQDSSWNRLQSCPPRHKGRKKGIVQQGGRIATAASVVRVVGVPIAISVVGGVVVHASSTVATLQLASSLAHFPGRRNSGRRRHGGEVTRVMVCL